MRVKYVYSVNTYWAYVIYCTVSGIKIFPLKFKILTGKIKLSDKHKNL